MSDEEKLEALNGIWRNFCVSDAFEPGSVAKPFTVAAALEGDSIKKDEIFNCDGYEFVNEQLIRCSEFPDFHGNLNAAGALSNSCNDCIMQIAFKEGAETLVKYQDIFNFGRRTGIDLPGESSGITFSLDSMGDLELATTSFGQGFTSTMVQEAAAMASIINGGNYYKPHTVKAIADSSGNILENVDSIVEKQTVSEEISEYIRQALGDCIEHGTGMASKVPGYSMGGKTGTAQKIPRDSGKYIVSFIGFAPLENPEVMVYVIVDEPNTDPDNVSSLLAQEISKQIFTELLPYLKLFPDQPVVSVPEDEEEYYEEEYYEEEYEESEDEGQPEEAQPADEGQPAEDAAVTEEAQQAPAEGEVPSAPAEGEQPQDVAAPAEGQPAEGEGQTPEGEVPPDGSAEGQPQEWIPGTEYAVEEPVLLEPPAAEEEPEEENTYYSDGIENDSY